MRTCGYKDCPYPVFGTDKNTNIGYCSRHQWCRTDKKPKKPNFRKPQKTMKESKPIEESFGFDDQFSLFMDAWRRAKDNKGDVICPFTGENLLFYRYRNSFFSCFAHVLPKGRFPYFKLNPENIRVVMPEFHRIVDQGRLKDRQYHPGWKWDEWDALVLEMKEKYAEFKKQNLLA